MCFCYCYVFKTNLYSNVNMKGNMGCGRAILVKLSESAVISFWFLRTALGIRIVLLKWFLYGPCCLLDRHFGISTITLVSYRPYAWRKYIEKHPQNIHCLVLVSLLKVGIPLVKINTGCRHGSNGIWNVEKYWFSRRNFPLLKMKPKWGKWNFGVFTNCFLHAYGLCPKFQDSLFVPFKPTVN